MAIQLIVTTSSASDINVDVVPVASQTITIDRGLIGPTGPAGPTTLAVGTTTTGAAGTSAFVANSGTSTAAVFDFTIPQGAAGAAGAAGVGVPVAGTVGQVLTKNSSTNYDTSWATPEVTLAGAQTLTNKTIAFADNTLTGVVSTTTAQTLTNKTLTSPVISSIVNTGTLTLPTSTDTLIGRATTDTLTNKTLTDPTIIGTITEDVFTITDGASVVIDPTNGSIQLWTLGASRTPTTANFGAGESITLMINDGTAYAITWTSVPVTWVGGTAPTLATTGYTVIELWKVASTIYGSRVGQVA